MTGATSTAEDLRERVLDVAFTLVARWGVAKSSAADVAREAGCSRATLYRTFPGGKQQVFTALARRELTTAVDAVTDAYLDGDGLADGLTRALVVGARLLSDNPAAQFVITHEPGLVLPYLGFGRVDRSLAAAVVAFGPTVARDLPADRIPWAVEWAVRVFISYATNPDAADTLVDPVRTRALVDTFIAPAFVAA